MSPRRFTSTASFSIQRVPSPKQPSPLVIDTTRDDDIVSSNDNILRPASLVIDTSPEQDLTLKTATTTVTTPEIVTSKQTSKLTSQLKIQRTKSTPPNIDLTRVSPSVPKLELSGITLSDVFYKL